ncbi:MAG: Gfo/Idh/MocA family oxidoreductase [Dehalococcoidia bacterium]|nr:Gfo/Idh/MocA family oxidoreductase [Dehalococcoidia bacterium]
MTLRVGIIGSGLFVHKAHLPQFLAMPDKFAVVAVCSRTRANAERLADRFPRRPVVVTDHRDLLARNDLDVVDICAPIALNAVFSRDALEAGKHVVCEKPIADTVAAAEALIALAQSRGRRYLVLENFRFHERYHAMRAAIDAGQIGRPHLYEAHQVWPVTPDSPYGATDWRRNGDHRGGWFLDSAVHGIAGLRVVAHAPAVAAQAMARAIRPSTLGRQPDTYLVNLTLADGALAHVLYSAAVLDDNSGYLKAYGEDGMLALNQRRVVANGVIRYEDWLERYTTRDGPAARQPLPDNPDNGMRAEFLDWYHAIADGAPSRSEPIEALRDLLIVDAAIVAAQSGQTVAIPSG